MAAVLQLEPRFQLEPQIIDPFAEPTIRSVVRSGDSRSSILIVVSPAPDRRAAISVPSIDVGASSPRWSAWASRWRWCVRG